MLRLSEEEQQAASAVRRQTVLLARPMIHRDGHDFLAARHDIVTPDDFPNFASAVSAADAIFGYRPLVFGKEIIEQALQLKVLAAGGSGIDHIDVSAADEAGIVVVRQQGVGARSVAEHAIGMMLCLAKKLVWTDQMTRQAQFDARWDEGFEEISGKTIAIIGFGSIGRELATICAAGFNMHVLAVGRSPVPETGRQDVVEHVPLAEALARADIVSVHVPLQPGAGHVIGAAEFALMRPGAWFINTARGKVVDERALYRALVDGPVACAGLDVFEHEPVDPDNPLLSLPNVVLSPHSAGFTRQSRQRLAAGVARDIDSALNGIRPAGIVSPHLWERSRAFRAIAKRGV